MKTIVMSILLIVVSAVSASAQEAAVVFHPGETIHILVSFKTPPISIASAVCAFGIVGQPDKKQEQLAQNFPINQVKKVTDTQFEVSGTIPEHIASGTFRLSWINIGINGVGKSYAEGTDFKELTIHILNPEHPEFPAIDDVKLSH